MKSFISVLLIITLSDCVPVEKWHKSLDGSLFYIENDAKFNWFQAWNECARKNMTLIAIDTFYKHSQIDALIRKLFPSCPSFWLAGHDNANDMRYEWATTGEIFTFTNWGTGQPDRLNNNEHCILIHCSNSWQWHDLTCTHPLGFICEENVFLKEKHKEVTLMRDVCHKELGNDSKYNIILNINRS